MKPKENIEEFVKVGKPHVTTSRQMDKRTLDDSFAAMEQSIRNKSAHHKPNTTRIITLSRMIKLTAAAAVIIVAISFFIAYLGPGEQGQVKRSPAEMVTAMSYRMAYRRGGMEALERQCDEAVRLLGPSCPSPSVADLAGDLNG